MTATAPLTKGGYPLPEGLIVQAAGALPLVYFNHGYEAGHRQAIRDLLAELVPLCERFISEQPGRAEELRKLLYPFEEYLERRIAGMLPDGTFVEGGLGI